MLLCNTHVLCYLCDARGWLKITHKFNSGTRCLLRWWNSACDISYFFICFGLFGQGKCKLKKQCQGILKTDLCGKCQFISLPLTTCRFPFWRLIPFYELAHCGTTKPLCFSEYISNRFCNGYAIDWIFRHILSLKSR